MESPETFCTDPQLDERIKQLHLIARAEGGLEVQCHIDAYLPPVVYLQNGGEPWAAQMMVLGLQDAPQEGRLPDLGPILRAMLMGCVTPAEKPKGKQKGEGPPPTKKPKPPPKKQTTHPGFPEWAEEDLSVQMLYRALPCLKRGQRGEATYLTNQQVGLNVLLGLLLGLYQHAVKFPPFNVRAQIFGEVHRMITGGGGAAFCARHPMLLALAYMEYASRVLPAYLPAEYELLKSEPGMEAFFQSCPLLCDTLRQELLNEEVDWGKLEAFSANLVDRHSRACKNRQRARMDEDWAWGSEEQQPSAPRGKPSPQLKTNLEAWAVSSFCSLPHLRPYAAHFDDPSNCIISSELAFLFGAPGPTKPDLFSSVAVMQRSLRVHPLPKNLIDMQLRALHAKMRVCERSARDAMVMYVCAGCCLQRASFQRGKCRLSSGDLVCSECQSQAILRINTLGRVVVLKGCSYYLAPCCFTIQAYRGTGLEFQTEFCDPDFFGAELLERLKWRPDVNPDMCTHRRPPRPQARPVRPRCEVCLESQGRTCGGSAAPELYCAVDHLTGEQKKIYLCPRHAPHHSIMQHVSNWEELMGEVQARDKPLFSGRRK
jgi:hypothetical protein